MIRKATKEDFPAIAEVRNRCWPFEHTTAEALEDEASKRPAYIKHDDFVAEVDGEVIAYAFYTQFPGAYHPQKFWGWVFVTPDYQNKSVGTHLFETLLANLQPYDPISLRTTIREKSREEPREEKSTARHLVEKWNFSESKRYWESRLNVSTFDVAPHLKAEEKPTVHGVEITTLAELSKHDGDYKEKYYDMWCEARLDVPRSEPVSHISYEGWHTWIMESPSMIPAGTFIAVDSLTKTYVGVSQLLKAAQGEHLVTGLTGVRVAYRRKGIALAMKLRGISYAVKHGVTEIRTSNEATNKAMLSINELLGYVKQPVWLEFVKVFKEVA